MGELQVALYETQNKFSSNLDTAPTNPMLSNDCLDNEDVILSCCAGLVRMKPPSHFLLDDTFKVGFFRMSFSSQMQEPQCTDHYLRQCPQIVQFRNTSSAFMAIERDSYERTIWPSHVSDIYVTLTQTLAAHAASAATHGGIGFFTVVCVTPIMSKRLPDIYRE